MEDSDDLFDDALILDEATLAILDKAELKHSLAQSSGTSTRPAKRQKTGHRELGGLRRVATEDDFEDMPEISLRNDGSYGIRGSQELDVLVETNSTVNRPVTSFAVAQNPPPRVPSQTENVLRPPPSRRASTPSSIFQRSHSGREAVEALSQTTSVNSANRFAATFRTSQSQRQNSPAPRASQALSAPSEQRLQRDIEILRAQVEELQRKAEQAEKAAKEAENARLAKEGEVSILRKGIERTAHEHAANILRLRSAKEAAEAAQTQLQKEMKDEMERLRTDFMFKQHEVETSFRKVPGTVRSSRINRDIPATPMRAVTPRVPQSSIRKQHVPDFSPLLQRKAIPRPQFGESEAGPSRFHPARQPTPQKAAPLPGFYNSFLSGPVANERRSSKKNVSVSGSQNGKGKGRHVPSPSLLSYQSQVMNNDELIPSPPTSPIARAYNPPSDDVVMDDVEIDEGHVPAPETGVHQDNEDATMDDVEGPELPDLPDEFRRIMFSHTLASKPLTLQILLSAPLPLTLPQPEKDSYMWTCSSLMRLLGTATTSWEALVQSVSDNLVGLIRPLEMSGLTAHLTALLDLLVLLCFAFPSFCKTLLSAPDLIDDAHQPPAVATALCDIIRNQLAPAKLTAEDASRELAEETMSLLEALYFGVDKASERYLADMLLTPAILTTLLDARHPPWLLNRTTRLLALAASRVTTYLLSYASSKDGREHLKPYIEHICTFLVDQSRTNPEMEGTRVNILTFFSMLCVMDSDAATMLLESPDLLPSLVVFITGLTIPLWEEERDPSESSIDLRTNIRTIYQTLFLMHYLVCSEREYPYDLKQKLNHAPYRQFNGLIHMFIVAFGRLSYADAPEWLSLELRSEVEDMTEMARDLLDLVVEGPELDSIYAAYQEEDSETDDDEIEARNLETNLLE